MSSSVGPALAARSPSSRKSLSAVSTSKKPSSHHRKRAKSIASTNPDELTPRSKRRRSLQPKKSILKQSNSDNVTAPLPSLSSSLLERRPTPLEDVTFNFTRVSRPSAFNPDRRVSFAPNAHVRLIPKDQPMPGSTPPSSPGNSDEGSPNTSQEHARPSPQPSPSKSTRRSSRQSLGDGEGEESMELASDNSYLDEQSADSSREESSANENRRESGASEGSSMDIDDSQLEDMDITMNMSVASQRLSMAKARRSSTRPPRRQSTRRESEVGDLSDSKPTEYSVALEESLNKDRPPSEAWLLLKAATNVGKDPEDFEAASNPTEVADMDLKTAAERLLKAGQDIPLVNQPSGEEDDTMTSSGDSTGSIGGKTMDFTSLTGGIHRMSMLTSEAPPPPSPVVASPAPPKHEAPETKPVEQPVSQSASTSRPGVLSLFTPKPLFAPKAPASAPAPRSASSSPVKGDSSPIKAPQRPKTPTFTAAFAPPTSASKKKGPAFTLRVPSSLTPKSPARETPQKRPPPVERGNLAESSTKKLIVEAEPSQHEEPKPQAVPKAIPKNVSTTPKSPAKSPMKRPGISPRRPSDYLKRPSMSTFARKSSITPSAASKSAPASPSKPFTPTTASATPTKQSKPPSVHATPAKSPAPTPVEETSAPVPPTPESPEYAQPNATDLPTSEQTSKDATRQLEAESTIATPPSARPSVATPIRTPLSRHSFAETALVTSPWLSKVKRPSAVSTGLGEDEDDVTNLLNELDEDARARLPHSVDELLRLVGCEFMDNMAARRRSTMALRVKDQCDDTPLNAADYANAMAVDFPMLSYYDWIVRHLEGHIDRLDQQQRETDDQVAEIPPPCFIDYATGGPEQLPELKAMLESLRHLARLKTKNQWYQWRLGSINDLYLAVTKREQEALRDLAQTQAAAAEVNPTVDVIEQEHARIMAELERERAAVVEIEKCDQKALAEVKSTIVDYATQIKMLEEEMAETQSEISSHQKRGDDFKSERTTLQKRLEVATKVCTTGHVKEDLLSKTRDEIKLLQLSSRWKPRKLSSSLVELDYDEQFGVTIPCINWVPRLEASNIVIKKRGLSKRRRDYIPAFTNYCVDSARQCLTKGKFGRTKIQKIISKLTAYWTCCEVMRLEIMMLRSKYIVAFKMSSSGKNLILEVPILFEKFGAKVFVECELSPKSIESWPTHVMAIKTRAKIGYILSDGVTIDTDALVTAMRRRMQQTDLSDNFGVLLETVIEADLLYK